MHADHLVGFVRGRSHLRYRQCRGIGSKNGALGADLFQLLEDLFLQLHSLWHGFDDYVSVLESLVGEGRLDKIHLLRHRGLVHLALVHSSLIDLPNPGYSLVQQLLVNILQDDGQARIGDDLGDLGTHETCAHHSSFEDVHALLPPSRTQMPGSPRFQRQRRFRRA